MDEPPQSGVAETPQSGVAETWMCPGDGVRKEEGMGYKPWVFLLAHSSLTGSQGTGLSPRLWFLQEPELGIKTCSHPVAILHSNNFKTKAQEHLIFTRPEGL